MSKYMFRMLIVVGLILGGVFGYKMFEAIMIKKYISSMVNRPQTVSTMVAKTQEWDSKIQAVGTFRAVQGVDISSEVAGIVEKIYFESGDKVEVGTLLVKLRSNDEIAALASLQADSDIGELTYKRDLKQLKVQSVAQAKVDIDLATLEKSRALVKQQKAIIDKKLIRAPFSGHLGLVQVDLGQYLSPGTVMVSLQELNPIYFDFYLPQQEISKIKLGQDITVTNDLYPDKTFVGKIWAINSKVDISTRNIKIRSMLENIDHYLLPGMYGVIDVNLGVSKKYITLTQTAITYNTYGNTVFVVINSGKSKKDSENLTVQQKFVTLGPTRGDQVAIIDGLEDGDVVVTSGQIKLQNDSRVNINNSVLPSNDVNPKPTEY